METTTREAAQVYTRREFLTYQVVMDGTPIFEAVEAVATTALAHPEWDMDQKMTWAEWTRETRQEK